MWVDHEPIRFCFMGTRNTPPAMPWIFRFVTQCFGHIGRADFADVKIHPAGWGISLPVRAFRVQIHEQALGLCTVLRSHKRAGV